MLILVRVSDGFVNIGTDLPANESKNKCIVAESALEWEGEDASALRHGLKVQREPFSEKRFQKFSDTKKRKEPL